MASDFSRYSLSRIWVIGRRSGNKAIGRSHGVVQKIYRTKKRCQAAQIHRDGEYFFARNVYGCIERLAILYRVLEGSV